jgi:hypothetical protein
LLEEGLLKQRDTLVVKELAPYREDQDKRILVAGPELMLEARRLRQWRLPCTNWRSTPPSLEPCRLPMGEFK